MTDLTLAADLGGSRLKVFYTLSMFRPELMTMEPEVALKPQQSIEVYENNKIGSAAPENSAWIEYKGKYHAVGFLAQKFYADLQLSKRKFDLALPKMLAIIGAISQKHELPNGAAIRLGVLLPWGEYQARSRFQQMLADALASFRFRGEERSFVMHQCSLLPEGGGVLTRGRSPGSDLKSQLVAVVMVGYRDVSVLVVNRGEISKGCTEPLGFSKMIDSVKAQTIGLDTSKLVEAICKAGKSVQPKALEHFVSDCDSEQKGDELAEIRKAITGARAEYWTLLSQWLRPRIPRDADEVILAGGTAHYFQAELNALFSHSTINWCDALEDQIAQAFAAEVLSKALQYRLTDVYGLFYFLCGTQAARLAYV